MTIRIDEALRRAGIKTLQPALTPNAPGRLLDGFPIVEEGGEIGEEIQSASPPNGHSDVLNDFPIAPPDAKQTSEPAPTNPPHRVSADPAVLGRLIVQQDVEPIAVEQYRHLAGALHQMQADKGVRTVMVVSAQPAEGKTLTAVNLALTLSESYHKKVLLIDADLRRPSLGRLFQVAEADGLSEILKSPNRPLKPVVVTGRLSLLPGGGADPDPMAGLTSARMEQILHEAVANFDWVVLDTPPVALLPDTHLLAANVDCAVLVIEAGATPFATVQRTIELIGRPKIAGVVLNCVEKAALKSAKYYEYYGSASAAGQQQDKVPLRTPPRPSDAAGIPG